jgi:hypothetical protein
MKRDWDVIRDILIEVEALDCTKFEHIQYGPASQSDEPEKAKHGVLLWKSGFIEGKESSNMSGEAVFATGLTWAGMTCCKRFEVKLYGSASRLQRKIKVLS